MSELLTAEELAQRFRIRADTVRAWARARIIPSVRVTSKVIRFDFHAVVVALKERQEKREVNHAG